MTLEESHCQATKRSNRGFVDARYLWVEVLNTNEESNLEAAKMPNRGSVNTRQIWVEVLMALQESFFIQCNY
jgi:hypothetical protein